MYATITTSLTETTGGCFISCFFALWIKCSANFTIGIKKSWISLGDNADKWRIKNEQRLYCNKPHN